MWLWKAGTLIVYLAVMVGVYFLAKHLVTSYGWWTGVLMGCLGILTAWLMDKSGKFTAQRQRRK
jgi:hypothetical protein